METPSKEGRINLALQDISKDNSLSNQEITTIYKVPRSTLEARRDGHTLQSDCTLNSKKLTVVEENVII